MKELCNCTVLYVQYCTYSTVLNSKLFLDGYSNEDTCDNDESDLSSGTRYLLGAMHPAYERDM